MARSDENLKRVQRFLNNNLDKVHNSEQFIKDKIERQNNDTDNLNSVKIFDIDQLQRKESIPKVTDPSENENRMVQVKRQIDLWNNRIRNVLLVEEGEIPFQDTFGSTIRNNLFDSDQDSKQESQRFLIQNKVLQEFPELIVNNVTIDKIEYSTNFEGYKTYHQGESRYKITIDYTLPRVENNILYDFELNDTHSYDR